MQQRATPHQNLLLMARCFAVLWVCWISLPLTAQQTKPAAAEIQQRLQALQREVGALKQVLQAKDQERSASERALRDADLALAESARIVLQLSQSIALARTQLADLNVRKQQLEVALSSERQRLAKLLRSAYAIGQLEQVKLALSQAKVAQIGRVLAYHSYVNQARIALIDDIKGKLSELTAVRAEIEKKTAETTGLIALETQKTAELQQSRARREQLLDSLRAELSLGANELERLNADADSLSRLLEQLSDLLADIPKDLASSARFASLKGRLPMPVQGEVSSRFGALSARGVRANGVLIDAEQGAAVHAIAGGRVAFADWLRGLGLLLIIDHGDGYLSLYGHCETLLKAEGDWINAGDMVATVGNSDRKQAGSALHFELRRRSEPIDPGPWFRQ
jgi:murein hydrolase activator